MDFISLLNEYHIIPQFPPAAVRQADTMPKTVSKADLSGRCDLTDTLLITIDGDDAKDFDDAVSLEILENGNFYLGVHIADVTHYVSENSPIDRAAFARGTSVYLIDTVIPMLPFELSNELCSLKPNEIRLAVSVFMEITPAGKVGDYNICKSFIRSRERMTYKKATKILEGDEELCTKYSHLVLMLRNMKRLAEILNKARVRAGSIEFSSDESKITLNHSGVPIAVERYPITVSNNIIEEFMLICNVTVAKYMSSKGLPCVYRVHERPDFEKIERLAKTLPILGLNFEFKPEMTPKDFQRLLKDAAKLDTSEVINYLALRAMSKARYSESNLGHFGLAFSDYCHFTSPIRRYPDIVVHRILKESLKGEISQNRKNALKELAISASVSSSISEVNAANAEFMWKDVKKAEYMSAHIGEKHSAQITYVTANGFFARLQNTVEGFIPARTIEDDLYVMTQEGLSLEGVHTKRRFTIGDTVEIKVAAVDLEKSRIDFDVVGKVKLPAQRRKVRSKRGLSGNGLSREDKKILRQLTEKSHEERKQKSDTRKKADIEKTVFENAVVYEVLQIIETRLKLKKTEKRFVGVMLCDMAAYVGMPIFKAYLGDSNEITLKNALISATRYVKNTVNIIGDSLGFKDEDIECFAAEYVCCAIRHFYMCLKKDDIYVQKRENEYDDIMKKLKFGKEKSK